MPIKRYSNLDQVHKILRQEVIDAKEVNIFINDLPNLVHLGHYLKYWVTGSLLTNLNSLSQKLMTICIQIAKDNEISDIFDLQDIINHIKGVPGDDQVQINNLRILTQLTANLQKLYSDIKSSSPSNNLIWF